MAHDHSHHHHHASDFSQKPKSFNLAFGTAVLLNSLFVVAEVIYSFAAHSMGLLADATHNFGDVLGLAMAWFTSWLIHQAAPEKYSYGFKKTSILSAISNALLLVFTSAIIMYESISRLLHPAPVHESIIIIVALVGIGINGGTALLFMRDKDSDLNIKGAFLHLASDALIAVAVVVSGIIIYYTKLYWVDPLLGLIIVAIILWGTFNLLRDSVNLILGAVPHGIDFNAVRQYLANLSGVTAVHDLHIWALSTQETALTVHLIMPEDFLSDADYLEINHVLQHDFKINHVTIQVEKGTAVDPCGQAGVC